jgi:hypothetical protein
MHIHHFAFALPFFLFFRIYLLAVGIPNYNPVSYPQLQLNRQSYNAP